MSLKDKATVYAYHKDRIARFGVETSEALGWKCKESQLQRFRELATIGDFTNRKVLDIGCGHGDFYSFISQSYSGITYTGLDNDSRFLDVALRRNATNDNTRFLLGDFSTVTLPRADFVICCGALNYRNSDADYLKKMISKFFDLCNIGLGLNLLSHVDYEAGILIPFKPELVVKFCATLTSKVELVQSPGQDHYTLFVYRDDV